MKCVDFLLVHFFLKFSLMILANNFCDHLLSVDFCLLRPQVFFTKSWKQQERFIPLLNFYELILYTLYIYTICEKKIEIKVVFFIFLNFQKCFAGKTMKYLVEG